MQRKEGGVTSGLVAYFVRQLEIKEGVEGIRTENLGIIKTDIDSFDGTFNPPREKFQH